jgi:hypothetical protein
MMFVPVRYILSSRWLKDSTFLTSRAADEHRPAVHPVTGQTVIVKQQLARSNRAAFGTARCV